MVTTPSAVLAVRGTEYGVAVSRSGDARLVVFEGVVEVHHRHRVEATVQIRAGFGLDIPLDRPLGTPQPHQMSSRDWDQGHMPGPSGSGQGTMEGAGPGEPGHGPGHGQGVGRGNP